MRNSLNTIISQAFATPAAEENTWTFPGAIVGFFAWLLALGFPFLFYGSNTLFFFLYTWPFFLALMPVAVVIGIAMHSLLLGRLVISTVATLITVAVIFGTLFLWLMG
ncbi:DUF3561 family protein [Atlantibacter sp.]|uniref:DUF3561 family protein n=1 Tax=Atlantibacter sp. TaxID=1903473 RepID=UPI0013EF780A|nr:DUF3561 family protein [Atlantibacter sp.]